MNMAPGIHKNEDPEQDNTVIFKLDSKEVLRLTDCGFIYKGYLIEDAGEARRIFIEVMTLMQNSMNKHAGKPFIPKWRQE